MRRAHLHLYLLLAIAASGLWADAPFFGVIGWSVIAAALGAAFLHRVDDQRQEPLPARRVVSFLVVAIVCAPATFFLIRSWSFEFPFIGDHNVHLRYLHESFAFWARWSVLIAAMLAIAIVAGRKSGRLASVLSCAFVVVLLLLGIFLGERHGFAIRYPGLFHAIAFPVNAIAHVFAWESPLDVGRLTNVLAIPAWLLILRPAFVRRWPDWRVLPFALFLFLQKDFVYFATTTYLEPWAVVLVITAIEVALVRGADGGTTALLLVGAAAMVKEQALLVLPPLALWAVFTAPRDLRLSRLIAAFVAVAPFLAYYDARRHAGIWRTLGFAKLSEALTAERMSEYGRRALEQFGPAIVVMIVLVLACLYLVWRGPRRLLIAAVIAAASAQALFFLFDRLAFDWVAYPRLHLLMYAMLATPLLLVRGRWIVVTAIVVVALHAMPLASLLAIDGQRQYDLNFFEHRDAPVYLPIRALVAEGERRGMLTAGDPLLLQSTLHGIVAGYGIASVPLAYPAIGEKYRVSVGPLDGRTIARCRCDARTPPVASFFVYVPPGVDVQGQPAAMQRIALECERLARDTCAQHVSLHHRGTLIGVLGSSAPAPTSR